ncbi:hypothetical protein O3M35_008106 [Rhynocoris fuscipes]|uniref:Uncharacterized protein n=1 Tax=Rhynocoris fuscipes TaxID=488301 RepID=A0AAW1D574_9HEMI
MAYRGSRGSNGGGGRGEALRQLLQKAESLQHQDYSRRQDEEAFEGTSSGIQRSTSRVPQSMGRSAALKKLLESASYSGEGRSMSEASSFVPRREVLPSRGTPRLPIAEPSTSAEPLMQASYSRGAGRYTESLSTHREAEYPATRGRMRTSPASSERAPSPVGGYRSAAPRFTPKHEEELETSMAQLSMTEDDSDKPAVIKKGSYGETVSVASNYVRLRVEEGKGVFMYDVKFSPEVDALNVRFHLMRNVTDIIGDTKSFDGAILYLPFLLPDKVTTCNLRLPTDDSKVTMKITFVKKLRMGDQTTLHLYNVLFRRIMNILGFALHGRHFFDPMSAMPITAHKLEVWPGYITAIHEYEDGIMLCCDASHRVLRTQTVHELMLDLMSARRDIWQDEFLKLIIGQTVLTRYNNKIYRVDDVAFDESASDSFEKRDGTKITYAEYYKHHYAIKIKDLRQPLLKSRVKGKIKGKEENTLVNLIPELCYLTGLTDTMRADMRVMKDIAQCTRISPNQRQYALNEFIKNVRTNNEVKKVLSSWGLSLAESNIKLQARVIPPEKIFFANSVVHQGSYNADWTKLATSTSVLSAIELNDWAVICTSRDDKVVQSFVEMVKKCSHQLGIKTCPPKMMPIENDSTQNYIKALQFTKGRKLQIVVIIFPLSRSDKYSAVKKWCCIDNPIPSQVIQMRTIRKPDRLRSVTQKILLQMNCKIGGALWAVDIPVKNAMVVGLDTFHDTARQGKSVGAIVASLNKPLTRWYSKVFTQSPGLELIDGLEVSILACLQKYREVNNSYPEQIIIYRDGVGDGQLNVVDKFEIPQIITGCRRISPNYDPKFLFVIVQKRISTRIFMEERNDYVNPSPGTVLDHTVTRKELWDFFLVSQNVRQGTVTPTHYIVLRNTTRMSPDQVQRFSYKLTHLYYNWSGTVRVPAPCQYAHKLAYLVGESIHKEAAESLADKLFFL